MKLSTFILAIVLFATQISASGNMEEKGEKEILVLISTDYGDIKVKLYNETPLHRDNFVKLVKEGFYDGTLFHRVIKSFMIQGGDPDSKNAQPGKRLGNGGPGYTVPAEFNPKLFHKKGALAAARQGDGVNPDRRSSGSQFYIVQGRVLTTEQVAAFSEEKKKAYTTVGGTPQLDNAYTVFGEVVEGLDLVDKIASVEVNRIGVDRPIADVKVTMKIIK